MSMSNYQENKILDHVYGGPDFTRPATLYVSLHSANPGDTGVNEILLPIGRKPVTNNSTNFPAASGGSKSMMLMLDFGSTVGNNSWPLATHLCIWDASTGGNLLDCGAFTTPLATADRLNIIVNAAAVVITRD